MMTGIASGLTISSDNGSSFCAKLTREFMSCLDISPVFSTPGHPQAYASAERAIGTLKNLISKLACDHKRSWHKYLGFVLWAMREVPNETTNCPPFLLVFGKLPRGPLSILRETWTGDREVPAELNKTVVEYLEDLRNKLEVAQHYANEHSNVAQERYVSRYNLRSRDKRFSVGEKFLILQRDNTASKVFSRWRGPAEIFEVKSPYSYIVALGDARYHMHANHLRKYHVRVDEVMCECFINMAEMSNPQTAECHCAII
jgi:hypothetical protein